MEISILFKNWEEKLFYLSLNNKEISYNEEDFILNNNKNLMFLFVEWLICKYNCNDEYKKKKKRVCVNKRDCSLFFSLFSSPSYRKNMEERRKQLIIERLNKKIKKIKSKIILLQFLNMISSYFLTYNEKKDIYYYKDKGKEKSMKIYVWNVLKGISYIPEMKEEEKKKIIKMNLYEIKIYEKSYFIIEELLKKNEKLIRNNETKFSQKKTHFYSYFNKIRIITEIILLISVVYLLFVK